MAESAEPPPPPVVVQVGEIVRTTLRTTVEAYGAIEPDLGGGGRPAGSARPMAPMSGVVVAVMVKEGDPVASGATVVQLDDRAALAAERRAQHAVEFAQQALEREQRLKALEGTSDKLLLEAARQLAVAQDDLAVAQTQVALLRVTTPLAGIVSRLYVQAGETVGPNAVVAEIVDPRQLVARVNVPDAAASDLKVGQAATVFVGSAPRAPIPGTVTFVYQRVEGIANAIGVRLALPADAGVRLGQLVRARIVTEERAGRLAVPISSLVRAPDGRPAVALVVDDGVHLVPVTPGLRDAGLVEVDGDGLREGMAVVTAGGYGLPEGTRVRGAGR